MSAQPLEMHVVGDEVSAIVGRSPAIQRVRDQILQVAGTDVTVLIRGESGTGKELIARAVHAESRRRAFPLVPVSCGALPDQLLESELFGHERGAFTGAEQRRSGRFELARGGTLFLDEVGAISPRAQVALLRVLETHEFIRLGGSEVIRVDFRVICATNENLEDAVAEGRFREDFLHRINVFVIETPALRERPSDIPLLAHHLLGELRERCGRAFTGFSAEAMARLTAHDWPGNVRELYNAIEVATAVGTPPTIELCDLPERREIGRRLISDRLADVERDHIARVLLKTGWNVTRAAELLGIDRSTVYNKINAYRLGPPPCGDCQ
jgi:DNA-binding NtrC family response regulator